MTERVVHIIMKSISGVLNPPNSDITSLIHVDCLSSKNAPSLAGVGACTLAMTVKALSPPANEPKSATDISSKPFFAAAFSIAVNAAVYPLMSSVDEIKLYLDKIKDKELYGLSFND